MLGRLGFVVTAAVGMLGGCATMPPVTMSYYLPTASTRMQVVQTAYCNAAGDRVVVANSVTSTTTYERDVSRRETFDIATLDSRYADADISFSFYDDGRLKGVNATTTGQGGEILKSAIGLVTTAVGAGVLGVGDKTPCEWIADFGGGKPVSLTYSLTAEEVAGLGRPGASAVFVVDPASEPLNAAIKAVLPTLTLYRQATTDIAAPAKYTPSTGPADEDLVMLTLTGLRSVAFDVRATYPGAADTGPFWRGAVTMPHGEYELPIPRAALFGKQAFGLTLADSGAVTSISYSRLSGVAGALGAANGLAEALSPDTAAERAADLKSQADLIAQQARLVQCQARPDECK